jgi:hypothetical protein
LRPYARVRARGQAIRHADHAQRLAEPTLIVPVDQAEELFASDGQAEAQQFLICIEALRKHLSAAGRAHVGTA